VKFYLPFTLVVLVGRYSGYRLARYLGSVLAKLLSAAALLGLLGAFGAS
jgi:hypothetical protein